MGKGTTSEKFAEKIFRLGFMLAPRGDDNKTFGCWNNQNPIPMWFACSFALPTRTQAGGEPFRVGDRLKSDCPSHIRWAVGVSGGKAALRFFYCFPEEIVNMVLRFF